jgi:aryl-alcohol dehydrogenase-like predicted oxidoreductase
MMRLLSPRVGIGTLRLTSVEPAVFAALDAGLRVFDSARAYGDGERRLGAALARHPAGGEALVITKGGMARPEGEWVPDGRAGALRRDCEASLEALGRPIDLYLVHAPDPKVKWSTTLRALARLKDEQLVRAVGVCNVSLAQLDEALALAPIGAVQVAFSLVDDLAIRSGVMARAREKDLLVIAHSPLGGPRRAKSLLATPVLVELARARQVAPAAIALASLLQAQPHVLVIPGVRDAESVRQVAAAATLELAADEQARLEQEFAAVRPPVTAATGGGEVVMVMGLPGAGKSALARGLIDDGFARLNRDELGGTLSGIALKLDQLLARGPARVVLDNTYVTRAQRAEVIAVAARRGVPVRGLYIATPLAEAQRNVVWRMLEKHGRLLTPDELRRGRDNTAMSPTALYRMQRTLEPPVADEGFAALESRAFMRVPAGGERATRFVTVELADQLAPDELATAFVIGWAPDAPAGLEAQLAERCAGVLLCRHGGGPPVCWCRPPLPGLILALAHAHAIDLSRSELHGTSRAHRDLSSAVGLRFVERPPDC